MQPSGHFRMRLFRSPFGKGFQLFVFGHRSFQRELVAGLAQQAVEVVGLVDAVVVQVELVVLVLGLTGLGPVGPDSNFVGWPLVLFRFRV